MLQVPVRRNMAQSYSFMPFHTLGTTPFGKCEWQAPQDLIISLIELRINCSSLSRMHRVADRLI